CVFLGTEENSLLCRLGMRLGQRLYLLFIIGIFRIQIHERALPRTSVLHLASHLLAVLLMDLLDTLPLLSGTIQHLVHSLPALFVEAMVVTHAFAVMRPSRHGQAG